MLKIRRPLGRLIFNMGIAIPGKTVFLIETAPRWRLSYCWLSHLCGINHFLLTEELSTAIDLLWGTSGTSYFTDSNEIYLGPWIELTFTFEIQRVHRASEPLSTNYPNVPIQHQLLTHWGLVTHICASKLATIRSDNRLSPGRRQVIILTNAGILLIRKLGTNFSDNLPAIHTFSFKKVNLKMSSGKWRTYCLGLNVLNIATFIRAEHKVDLIT